jgi:hypothetical protein
VNKKLRFELYLSRLKNRCFIAASNHGVPYEGIDFLLIRGHCTVFRNVAAVPLSMTTTLLYPYGLSEGDTGNGPYYADCNNGYVIINEPVGFPFFDSIQMPIYVSYSPNDSDPSLIQTFASFLIPDRSLSAYAYAQ